MVVSSDPDALERELVDEKPEGVDLQARQWRADIAAKLFGAPPADVRIGRYIVAGQIGRGATGIVYAAHDPELDRPVALKLLRSDAALPGHNADAWLAREAKTLARLSHPNVLAVYDVGSHEGQVFMAVELVTGATLHEWSEQPRTLAEVVEVFAQAARGLAAAHAAGLVHRDFKPANVLVGDDGRVRVSDFGIAWHLDRDATANTRRDQDATDPSRPDATATHTRAGTPAYMAPEQFLGDPVDGRTDQFGFCVALHEAVYGQRPFAGTTRENLAANVIAGRRRLAAASDPPPAWLERVIARGLSVDPNDRYPTMTALVADLCRAPNTGRVRWVIGSTVAAALTATVFVVAASNANSPSPCADGAQQLAGVWNAQRIGRIATAFRATGVPYAQDSARSVQESVTQYGQRWVDAHAMACQDATPVVIARRMHCLQSRLLELDSLGEHLAGADAATVEYAVASVGAMVGPAECLYVGDDNLGSPSNSRPDEAAQLRWTVARAKVMGDAGHPREGLTIARQAVLQARDVGDRALEAEALLVAGAIVQSLAGAQTGNEAESMTYEAILAAEATHRPDLTARALVQYLGINESLGRLAGISKWEDRARDAVAAVGSPPALLGRIDFTMAMVHDARGDTQAARAAAERALQSLTLADAADRHYLATVYNLLGELTFGEGRYEDALPYYERAFEVVLEELGPHHAWTANAYGNAAEVHFKLGRYEQSLAYFEAALAIRLEVFGPESVWVVHGMAHVGDLRLELGRIDDAIEIYARALSIRAHLRALAGDRPDADAEAPAVFRDLQAWDQEQWLHNGLALAYAERGDFETALQHASAIQDPQMPRDRHHPDLIGRADTQGQVLLAAGRWEAALASLLPAYDTMRAWYGPTHADIAWPASALGRAELELGRLQAARTHLEAALACHDARSGAHPRAIGDTRFALARTLWQLGEHDPALRMARLAQADHARAANPLAGDRTRIAQWLKDREIGG